MLLDLPSVWRTATSLPPWLTRATDVRREDELASAFAVAAQEFGTIDIVIACAGVVPSWSPSATVDLGMWDSTMAVNAWGVMATIKHAVPVLTTPGASIVAVASLNAWRAHPQQAAYTASKHAVAGIVKATAADLGPIGIRVNALAPGAVSTQALLTRMARRTASGGLSVVAAIEEAAQASALRRLATPEEVADSALFLASHLSSGITGHILPVDAGIS